MWALKVDINLLNQHCKPADWLADWLTDWLADWLTEPLGHSRNSRHSGTRARKALEGDVGTPALKALEHLGHSGTPRALEHLGTQGTRAIGHLRHLDIRRTLGYSGTLGLRHLGTRAFEGHLGTQAFMYSSTWALEAFKALYLANSSRAWGTFFLFWYAYTFFSFSPKKLFPVNVLIASCSITLSKILLKLLVRYIDPYELRTW